MALISCTECRKKISSKAATCPSCGAPVAKMKAKGLNKKTKKSKLKTSYQVIGSEVVIVTPFPIGSPSVRSRDAGPS